MTLISKIIKNICNEYDIKIIEDVAQAFGSGTEKDIKLGSIGDMGAFSFSKQNTWWHRRWGM